MAQTLIFDTFAYVKRLVDAGMPEKQAQIQAETLVQIIEDKVATKQDLQLGLKELEVKIKDSEVRLNEKMEAIRADLLKWVAGMLVAQGAIVAALVKLL